MLERSKEPNPPKHDENEAAGGKGVLSELILSNWRYQKNRYKWSYE